MSDKKIDQNLIDELLSETQQESSFYDNSEFKNDSKKQLVCPLCNHQEVKLIRTEFAIKKYLCNNCGKEFSVINNDNIIT